MLQIIARLSPLLVLSAWLLVGAHSHAQTFEEVLKEIESPRSSVMTVEERKLLVDFRGDGDLEKMKQRLENAQEALSAQLALESVARAEADETNKQVAAAHEELQIEAAAIGELFAHVKLSAEQASKRIEGSLANFAYPGRAEALRQFSDNGKLPSRDEIEFVTKAMLQEMSAQSEVKRFNADVLHASTDWRVETTQLLRVGVFQAVTIDDAEFVVVQKIRSIDGPRLILATLPVQDEELAAAMNDLINSEAHGVARVPIDHTRGRIFIEQTFGPSD